MTKVVINDCYGGFSLSIKAVDWLETHGAFNTPQLQKELQIMRKWMGTHNTDYCCMDPFERDNPLLVQCVEELGESVNPKGVATSLIVREEDGKLDEDFFIGDYDGNEEIFYDYYSAETYSNQP